MKELEPTVAEAEALAVELLHPSILSPVARKAAERALSDDVDSPTSNTGGESSSADGCGISPENGSGTGHRQGSSYGSGSNAGLPVVGEQQTRNPVCGRGFAVDSDGSEEELFQFEKAWLRELTLKWAGVCDEVTRSPSPSLPETVDDEGGSGEHQPAVVVESRC